MSHFLLRVLSVAVAVVSLVLADGCTPPPSPPPPPAAEMAPAKPPHVADQVVVMKSQRILELMHDGKAFETFPIALSAHATGTKRQAGDHRTPEGVYQIDSRTMHTRWTRELHISYPNPHDRSLAQKDHVDPGGGIYIHGLPRDFGPYDPPKWEKDWTEGCIAVGNAAIVKIWDAVPDGTPIDIRP